MLYLPVFIFTGSIYQPFFTEPPAKPSTHLNLQILKHFIRALSFIYVSEIGNISDINDTFGALHCVITVG